MKRLKYLCLKILALTSTPNSDPHSGIHKAIPKQKSISDCSTYYQLAPPKFDIMLPGSLDISNMKKNITKSHI